MGLTRSSHAGVCCPRKNGALCVSKSFVLPIQLFLWWPISAIVVALSWPRVEQFLPSQISFRHSKQCRNIMVWRFLLRRDEEMEGRATGVNKIPPLQQVPRDTECPWKRQHLTFARHLRALPCGLLSSTLYRCSCLSPLSPFSHLLLHLLKPTAVRCRARLCAPTRVNLISSGLESAIIGSSSVKQTSLFFARESERMLRAY